MRQWRGTMSAWLLFSSVDLRLVIRCCVTFSRRSWLTRYPVPSSRNGLYIHSKTQRTTGLSVVMYVLLCPLSRYVNSQSHFILRFQFTVQLALYGLAEYVLHLTRLNPEMMYIHKDSGYINISYFKFEIDEQSGKYHSRRTLLSRHTQLSIITTSCCVIKNSHIIPLSLFN